jgi:hypothetical protein
MIRLGTPEKYPIHPLCSMEEVRFSKRTLHYMKKNAAGNKPFTLNKQIRERLEKWEDSLLVLILSHYSCGAKKKDSFELLRPVVAGRLAVRFPARTIGVDEVILRDTPLIG